MSHENLKGFRDAGTVALWESNPTNRVPAASRSAILGAGGTGDKGRQQRPWTAQQTQRESCAAATLSCDTLPRPIAPPPPEKT